ncbi:DNA-3-methyladenine glycosylase 1 [Geodia barretti]|uniref:DNA-3-methyladenine glycosylase 1 n=1 Tax=Geodia barretti TaxID=519541 RepID=A0AA35XB87_GEOBA|nr:DNA-3-methyladenine glycosylase 1 [Geodia barretti]
MENLRGHWCYFDGGTTRRPPSYPQTGTRSVYYSTLPQCDDPACFGYHDARAAPLKQIGALRRLQKEYGLTTPDEEKSEIEQWAQGDPLREWYAREVWGKPTEDDDSLFEVMSLQVFQAGLSWHLILTKRDAFRNAFHGWRIDQVATMGPPDVERLLLDPAIVRNRRKIEACISKRRRCAGAPAGARRILQLVLPAFCPAMTWRSCSGSCVAGSSSLGRRSRACG